MKQILNSRVLQAVGVVAIVAFSALGARMAFAGTDNRDQRLIDTELRLVERAPTLKQLKADQAVDEGIVQAFNLRWDESARKLVPLL